MLLFCILVYAFYFLPTFCSLRMDLGASRIEVLTLNLEYRRNQTVLFSLSLAMGAEKLVIFRLASNQCYLATSISTWSLNDLL